MNDLLTMKPGQTIEINGVLIRYDGRYDWIAGPDGMSYTLLGHFIDAAGADRFKGSFSPEGLAQIGLLKGGN